MVIKIWTGEKVHFNKLDATKTIFINSHDNVEDLQKVIDYMDEDQQKKVMAYVDAVDDDLGFAVKDVLQHDDDMYLHEGMTMVELAEEMVDEGLYGNVADELKYYIDFNKLADSLENDGYWEYEGGVFEWH